MYCMYKNSRPEGLIESEVIIDAINIVKESILVLDEGFAILFANEAFYDRFAVLKKNTIGKKIFSIGGGQFNIPKLKQLLEDVEKLEGSFEDYEITHEFPKIGVKAILLSAKKLITKRGLILVTIADVTESNAAKSRLEQSEVRYRKLFETAQDGILLIDPGTEKIIDANPFLLKMIGYSLDETVGKKLWEIGTFSDIKATKEIFSELQSKGYARYESLPLKAKDGREIEVEFVSNSYYINELKMIQCNIRDITDRKKLEKKEQVYLEGLERINKFMVGRELKMVELKEEIKKLKKEIASN